MKKEIADLVQISRFYGNQKDYTLGGGGNTSYKDASRIYVKASGHALASIGEDGFAVLDRSRLQPLLDKSYPTDPQQREQQVKNDLLESRIDPSSSLRPSVETLLHHLIPFSFVVHTHPHLINGLLCSRNVENEIKSLFGEDMIYVPYTDPGIVLSRKVESLLKQYGRSQSGKPQYIFLQNHGVFVAADSIEEVKELYGKLEEKLMGIVKKKINISDLDLPEEGKSNVETLREFLSDNVYAAYRYNSLVYHFTKDNNSLKRINKPFIPDQIVYCKAYPLIIKIRNGLKISLNDYRKLFTNYRDRHGYDPKVILFRNGPLVAIEEKEQTAQLVLDVFEDAMKISFYSHFFGGPHFMTPAQVAFIENWEAENYRRKISGS